MAQEDQEPQTERAEDPNQPATHLEQPLQSGAADVAVRDAEPAQSVAEDEQRKQQVKDALEEPSGQLRRQRDPFFDRDQVRPDELTRTAQQDDSGKADDGRLDQVPHSRMRTQRPQENGPAQGASEIGGVGQNGCQRQPGPVESGKSRGEDRPVKDRAVAAKPNGNENCNGGDSGERGPAPLFSGDIGLPYAVECFRAVIRGSTPILNFS